MAEITKPDLSALWASGGALVAPSNSKIQQGWTAEIPPHQWENFIQNRQDNALAYLYQMGIAQWDNTTDYIANKSVVMHNGNIYTSIQNSKNVAPPNSTYWKLLLSLVTTTEHGLMSAQDKIKLNNLDTLLDTKADKTDTRITNALQRGDNLSDLTNASTARVNLGLGNAATRNVGTSSGQLMEVGAFGLGALIPSLNLNNGTDLKTTFFASNPANGSPISSTVYGAQIVATPQTATRFFGRGSNIYGQSVEAGVVSSPYALLHTGNILSTTGQSTLYPMTQKSVTDALNTKANSATLTTELNKKADKTITISAGTGLSGGGTLAENRTINFDASWGDNRYLRINGTANNAVNLTGITTSITIAGNADTYYPVVISGTTRKEFPTFISVWKNLGSDTNGSYSGNHTNGTSSLWLQYESRETTWDGNGGYHKTLYKSEPYATLVAETNALGNASGALTVWLRGGGTQYYITVDNPSVSVNVYYTSTEVTSGVTVAPRTTIGNGGIFNTVTGGYGSEVPRGIISMWSGSVANIPSGWALCNGANGTPDLRGRFVIGAGGSYAVGSTGGGSIPSHSHGAGTLAAASDGAHTHTGTAASAGGHSHSASTNSTGAHTHSVSGTAASAGAHAHTFDVQRSTSGITREYISSNSDKVDIRPFNTSSAGAHTHSVNGTAASAGGHSHTVSITSGGAHTHTVSVTSAGAHTHTISGSTATAGSGSEVIAKYYALCFIMKL